MGFATARLAQIASRPASWTSARAIASGVPVGLALAWLTSQTFMSPLGNWLWNFAQKTSFLSDYRPWGNLWVSLRPLSQAFLRSPVFFQTMAICKSGLTYCLLFVIPVLFFPSCRDNVLFLFSPSRFHPVFFLHLYWCLSRSKLVLVVSQLSGLCWQRTLHVFFWDKIGEAWAHKDLYLDLS